MNNRLIKFRAWHKEGQSMLFAGDEFGTKHGLDCCRFAMEGQPVELMQFTGLHDKRGEEIYEGDIVKHTMPHTPYTERLSFLGKIEYVDVNCSFRTVSDYYGEEPIHEDIELEVVGNIYENPELLEEL